ncbi:MAG: hypothetical protein HY700_12110 [Gemmatimonadetes bacterium]|nr:hypothetical protein [Gemmatimonadota bacterium]
MTYRLPPHPSRLRLAVWRRLKRSGAVLLDSSVWILPFDARNQETFEWLAEEIEEAGGRAWGWTAESLETGQDQVVLGRFRREMGNRYALLVAAARQLVRTARRDDSNPLRLRRALRQLGTLQRTLRLENRRDYFGSPGRQLAESAIAEARRQVERLARSATSPPKR